MNNEPLCFSGTFKAATLQLSLGEYTTFAIRSQFPRSEEHVPLKFQSCVNIFLGNIEPFHGKTCQKSVFCQCWLPFQLLLWISEMVLLDDFPEEVASSPSLSVQFSRSVVSDSLQPHESQHAKPLCPSPTPSVYPNLCPLSQWCHPAISSSVVPFSSCPQSLPASESFPMSPLFTWGGQSTGLSALALFLPKNTQGWSPLEGTGWISLQSKGLSRVFSNTTVQKHQFFGTQLSLWSNSHIYTWLLEKNIALTRQTFVGKVTSLLFNMLPRLVITFLPRSVF